MGCTTSSLNVRDENDFEKAVLSDSKAKALVAKFGQDDNNIERKGVNNASTCSNSIRSRNLGESKPFSCFLPAFPRTQFYGYNLEHYKNFYNKSHNLIIDMMFFRKIESVFTFEIFCLSTEKERGENRVNF